MNNFSISLMKDNATVWPVTGQNEFGVITYDTPYLISCAWVSGGKLTRDANGNEFVPMDTYRTVDARPNLGDYIALGDFTVDATPSSKANANQIRKEISKTPFQNWSQRYTYLTG